MQMLRAGKSTLAKLNNPMLAGQSIQQYYTENYEKATKNPYVYGYMQFYK